MEEVIKSLDSTVLESFGFTYDGYYWVHGDLLFKLIKSNQEGVYMVHIDNLPIGMPSPDPVKNNSDLLNLMIISFRGYMQQHKEFLDPTLTLDQMSMKASELLVRYLGLRDESKVKLIIRFTPTGLQIIPADEFTHTILTGTACEFLVRFNDDSEEVIQFNPECISYPFLKRLYPDKEIRKVQVMTSSGYEDFYGLGIQGFKTEDKPE